MPPRYAYWTILIDNQATAFRAREREELLPTLAQLRRTNADVVMKWFARGRIWESREAEIEARHRRKERRSQDWRPGGNHQDPRDRFRKQPGRRPAAAQRPTGSPEAAKPPQGQGQSAVIGTRRFGRSRRPFRPGKNDKSGQTLNPDAPPRPGRKPRKSDWRRRS
jgi:hypothetical protein